MEQPKEALARWLREHTIDLSDSQLDQFEIYYEELTSWNERMNLTGITERGAVYEKHFYDSVSLAFFVPMNELETIADIGSGAGFPSIPLKIVFPHLKVTIVDSLQKRIGFLHHLVNKLGLDHVECVHGRAEDVARNPIYRDRYDAATARAVARMNVLAEFCLPFVRTGGQFIAMKGSDPSDELIEATYAFRELGGKLVRDISLQLPLEQSGRHIIVVEKMKQTPKAYPRKPGTPLRSPLVLTN